MVAAMKNDTQLMRALIDAKADQSAQDPNGRTAFTLEDIAKREAAGREAARLEAARAAEAARAVALEAAREEAARKAASPAATQAAGRTVALDPGLADLALAIIMIGTGGGGA
jgi:hypothetical protein